MTRTFRKALATGAAVCAIALSTAPTASFAQDSAPAPEAAAETADASDWGTFGIQTQWIDKSVDPGDDFDAYVNGAWIKQTEIPSDRSRWGSFDELRELSETRMRGILDGLVASDPAPGTDAARVAAAYNAYMDVDAINAAGLAPARPYLDRIYAAKTKADLMRLFASPGYASPMGVYVGPDDKQSDIYALRAYISGLGLPDRDYYLEDTEKFRDIRAKYVDLLAFMLGKAGYEDPQAAARAVMSLETEIARADWDRAASRNDNLTYNKMSMAEFEALGSAGLVEAYVDEIGAGAATYVLATEIEPTAEELKEAEIDPAEAPALFGSGIPGALKLVEDVPMSTWQAYLAAHFLSSHASVLPTEIDDRNFAFYGTTLSGQPEQRPRWKRGIGAVEGQVGELVGEVYADKYYSPRERDAMTELVANLRKAMGSNLENLSWMGPETRIQAKAKLDAFTPKIGEPTEYKKYEGLEISPTEPLGNMMAAGKWDTAFQMDRIGKPVDRAEWHMFPQTVNAYYNPPMNEIVFPAAILQPPFFNADADPAVNYGAIGAVIGHEMGHGFDDQGANYDGKGILRDWWTAADKANFRKLQDKFGAQYAQFCPFDEGKTCVNPKLTMGENIGDLGGLSMAYKAYRLSLNGKEAPVIDGYTGDQRFFLAWAQVWRQKIRDEAARQQLVSDPHSPAHYRVNGIVRNFDEWYKAFDVKPGDELYLAPSERVRIW
jgi:putative endopeptidase